MGMRKTLLGQDNGFGVRDDNKSFYMPCYRPGQNATFYVPPDMHQVRRGLAMGHPLDVLLDNGAVIQIGGHIMGGGADDFDAPCIGLLVWVGRPQTPPEGRR